MRAAVYVVVFHYERRDQFRKVAAIGGHRPKRNLAGCACGIRHPFTRSLYLRALVSMTLLITGGTCCAKQKKHLGKKATYYRCPSGSDMMSRAAIAPQIRLAALLIRRNKQLTAAA